jgi:P63C domain
LSKIYCQPGARQPGDIISYRRATSSRNQRATSSESAICDVWLDADDQGRIGSRQKQIAAKAKIIIRALAHVGIVALVDEATGYQRDRAKDALARILEAFIAKELQPYVRTFPGAYYEEMFRLRGLEYPQDSVKRPQYFGTLTNNIVYERLAPGVLEELHRITPRRDGGGYKQHLFRRLTANVGYPKLREHLGSVVTAMKLSDDWPGFMEKLDRLHPRFRETELTQLDFDFGEDAGKGFEGLEDEGHGL